MGVIAVGMARLVAPFRSFTPETPRMPRILDFVIRRTADCRRSFGLPSFLIFLLRVP